MKALTTVALVAVVAALSGCVVAPARGDYRDQDHSYDHRYRDRERYTYGHSGERRTEDGDHAGGTGTPD